jgi:hypothetical protein
VLSSAGLTSAITFLSVKVSDLGGGFLEFGTIFAISAACEVIFLLFLKNFLRFIRPQGIIMIGFFFVTVRVVCLSLTRTIPQIWLVSLLNGTVLRHPCWGGGGLSVGGGRITSRCSTAQTGYAAANGWGGILGQLHRRHRLSPVYSVNTMMLMSRFLPGIAFLIMAVKFITLEIRIAGPRRKRQSSRAGGGNPN